MPTFLFGVFLILHGLVHSLYAGQSRRLFELQPGLVWPQGSWAFAKPLGDEGTRLLATACCVLAASGFVAGGIGLLITQPWWRPVVAASAAFSTAVFTLFWDGRRERLDQKGAVGILINVAIMAVVLVFGWPDLGV